MTNLKFKKNFIHNALNHVFTGKPNLLYDF